MSTLRPERWQHSGLAWLPLLLVLLVLDLATKELALATLDLHRPVHVLPVLNWHLTYNTGAAFSLLASAGGWQRWFFLILAAVISMVLLVWLRRTPRGEWPLCLALCGIVAGAIGNAVDRVRFGHVVDFIQLHWQGLAWPTFNVADAAISCGAVLLVLIEFGWPRHRSR